MDYAFKGSETIEVAAVAPTGQPSNRTIDVKLDDLKAWMNSGAAPAAPEEIPAALAIAEFTKAVTADPDAVAELAKAVQVLMPAQPSVTEIANEVLARLAAGVKGQ